MKLDQIVQPTYVNEFVKIGKGSIIWRYCNLYGTKEANVCIGANTQVGSYCEIKPGVRIGNFCRLQSYVFIPEGIVIKDEVFVGPRVCFTNDKYPDIVATLNKTWKQINTTIDSYVNIGAGAIILPGAHLEKHCQVGAGAVVTKPVPAYAIVVGNPGRIIGDVRDKRYKR